MMAPAAACCCCCMSNNVRQLVLLLSLFCVAALFADLSLFNLSAVLHDDLEDALRPVGQLGSLHPHTGSWKNGTTEVLWQAERLRMRRSFENASEADDQTEPETPIVDDPVTQIINSQQEEGHPILASEDVSTTTTAEPTTMSTPTTTAKVFYITSYPTSSSISPVAADQRTTEESYVVPDVVKDEVRKAIEKLEIQDIDLSLSSSEKRIVEKSIDDGPVKVAAFVGTEEYLSRTLLYAAPGIGCLVGILPSMVLIRSLGLRKMVTFSLFLSSLITLVFPFLVPLGIAALFPLRLLLGICFSVALPMAGGLAANWATLREQLIFLATIFLFVPLGPLLSWPLTMWIFSSGCPLYWTYIIHASFTAFCGLLFLIFYRDRPQYHPWVNGLELNRIVAGKVQELRNNRVMSNPCTSLLRSLSTWAIWIAAFGYFCAVSLLVTFLPAFLSSSEVLLIENLGCYTVLPFFLLPVLVCLGGALNRLSCASSTAHVRIFNTLAFALTAVLLGLVPIAVLTNDEMVLLMLVLCVMPLGLIVCGFMRSVTIVGRYYAQHIVGYQGVSFGLAFTVVPIMITSFVEQNSLPEWIRSFLCVSAILLVTGIVFAVFGRGRSAGWAESSWDPLAKTKMLTLEPIDRSHDECGLYEMRLIGPAKR